ncbi:hypothetical protein FB45DRAFT_1034909 [Roridomyces roridus]|uniref:Uncharacterized protein n=1 Tax=Roridomyces roridus TaxID=1738132 RepID=A0AAD7FG37_9AGAR|nr:hypothetical protein FB45DRAFT_1034909 [Roridomyces roridus]
MNGYQHFNVTDSSFFDRYPHFTNFTTVQYINGTQLVLGNPFRSLLLMAPEPLSPDSAAMKAGAQLVEAVAAYRSIDKTMTVLIPTRKTLLAQAVNLGGHLYAFKEALHLVEMTPAKEALFHVRDDALEAKKECGFEPPAAAMKECALALQYYQAQRKDAQIRKKDADDRKTKRAATTGRKPPKKKVNSAPTVEDGEDDEDGVSIIPAPAVDANSMDVDDDGAAGAPSKLAGLHFHKGAVARVPTIVDSGSNVSVLVKVVQYTKPEPSLKDFPPRKRQRTSSIYANISDDEAAIDAFVDPPANVADKARAFIAENPPPASSDRSPLEIKKDLEYSATRAWTSGTAFVTLLTSNFRVFAILHTQYYLWPLYMLDLNLRELSLDLLIDWTVAIYGAGPPPQAFLDLALCRLTELCYPETVHDTMQIIQARILLSRAATQNSSLHFPFAVSPSITSARSLFAIKDPLELTDFSVYFPSDMPRRNLREVQTIQMLEDLRPPGGTMCGPCQELCLPCIFVSWGRACRRCTYRFCPCEFTEMNEFLSFRRSPICDEQAVPFHRKPVPYSQLLPFVPRAFEILRESYHNRTRREIKSTFERMSISAILTWLMQHETDPYFHPDVEHLALKVLIERGHPDSLNALFAIRQSGTLTFTATARPVRTP